MKSTRIRVTLALLMACMIVTCFAGCSKKTPQEAIAGTYHLYKISAKGKEEKISVGEVGSGALLKIDIDQNGTCLLTKTNGKVKNYVVSFLSFNDSTGEYILSLQEAGESKAEYEGKILGDDLYLKHKYLMSNDTYYVYHK